MGCWNKTCALSNLHIHAGDPVYVFIIEENTIGKDHCYSSHLYRPVLVPFHSHYDDYGTGENSTGIGLQVIIDSLKKNLIEMEVGENSFHDIAVKKEDFNESLLFESIRENRLFIPNQYASYANQPKHCAVEFVMMRKDVVDNILKKYKQETYASVNGKFKRIKYNFDDILNDVDCIIEHLQEQIAEYKKHKLNESSYPLTFKCIHIQSIEDMLKAKNSKSYEFVRYFNSYHISNLVDIMIVVYDLVEKNEIDTAKEFLIDSYKGAYIASFMEHTRKSWIPQCGEGSQNIEYDGHKLLAQTILDVIKKEKKERYD